MNTQRQAFIEIQPKLVECQNSVFSVIKKMDGATLFEICNIFGFPVNRVSGRVTELQQKGVIVDSGFRRTNPLSGKKGIVWKVVNK